MRDRRHGRCAGSLRSFIVSEMSTRLRRDEIEWLVTALAEAWGLFPGPDSPLVRQPNSPDVPLLDEMARHDSADAGVYSVPLKAESSPMTDGPKRPRPTDYCTKCGAASGGVMGAIAMCQRPIGGGRRCGGRLRWAGDISDWTECGNCAGTGLGSVGECLRCRGHGWIVATREPSL